MLTTFALRFFWCSGILTIILLSVLIAKRFLKKHMTAKARYGVSKFVLLFFALPFIPANVIRVITEFLFSPSPHLGRDFFLSEGRFEMPVQTLLNEEGVFVAADDWMKDFALTVQSTEGSAFWPAAAVLIAVGACVLFLATVSGSQKYHRERRRGQVPDSNLLQLFKSCKSQMGKVDNVQLLLSPFVQSPVTFGIIRPVVFLPYETPELPDDELRHILLHELQHCRRRDAVVNLAMCMVRCMYWFNPLVWYYLWEMETERELSCDAAVLELLGEGEAVSLAYGTTLLTFARMGTSAGPIFRTVVSEMSSSGKQLRTRILSISNYKKITTCLKVKSVLSMTLIVLIALCAVPGFGVYGAGSQQPSMQGTGIGSVTENGDSVNFDGLFSGYEGSFVLSSGGNSFIYNEEAAAAQVSPYSTYKIFSALFALESGVITPQESVMAWNGKDNGFVEWNRDQDLRSAMSSSVTWYFQELDRKLGHETLQAYLTQIDYGNKNPGKETDIDSFWIASQLKISPLEQVLLLERFNEDKLGFSVESTETVKSAILLEDRGEQKLYGKTGTSDQGEGWFIGFVESEETAHYFALYLNGPGAKGSVAAEKTLSILRDMEIM